MSSPAPTPSPSAEELAHMEELAHRGPTHCSNVGHIGHLDQLQEKLLEDFRVSEQIRHEETLNYLTELDKARVLRLNQREATEEELAEWRKEREDEWPYELTRFLRAAKWKMDEAQKKYSVYLEWRRRERIDSILDEWPFNALLIDRVVGNNAAGYDKKGRPLYFEKSGSVNVDGILSCFNDEDVMRSHIFQQEQSCFRAAAMSKVRGEHVELFTQIVDLKGLTMSGNRGTKYTKLIFELDGAFYPERLGDLYIINAPWVFPIIWKVVKAWIDPVTRAKIHVISGDCKQILREYIDEDQLPQEYGGTCNVCPNSPDCVKQYTHEDFAAMLPLSINDPASLGGVELKNETIKAGKKFTASMDVSEEEGGVVEWFWHQQGAKGVDIEWSVVFIPLDKKQQEIKVVEQSRIEKTDLFSPQGSYKTPSAGTVVCCWDNHYSWMTSKSIQYMIRRTAQRRPCTMPYDEVARMRVPDIRNECRIVAEKWAKERGITRNQGEINGGAEGGGGNAVASPK